MIDEAGKNTSNLKPTTKAKTVSSNPIKFPEIEKKLQLMFSHVSSLSKAEVEKAKMMLDGFIQGKELDLKFVFGSGSKLNEVLVRGLMNIYISSGDSNLQIKAKDAVKNLMNPMKNPILFKKIIETYNASKYCKFPVKKIDSAVNWAMSKSFEMYFTYKWEDFLKKNIGPNNTFINGNFIGLMYTVLTGSGGTRSGSWFADYYNSYKTDPEKFKQAKPSEPNKPIDRTNHTVSDIIKYVYSLGKEFNPKIIDSFNKANEEIVDFLKKNVQNPLAPKVFQYTIINKLDTEEIMDFDKSFDSSAKITGTFRDLVTKNSNAIKNIDLIYKKHGLNLPTVSTWKTSDFIKAPSDRGELKPDNNEVGRDEKGNLAKISYDKFGNKYYSQLQELRLLIRKIIQENLNKQ